MSVDVTLPGTLYIRNWRKFQHYKNRNAPWVKLHRSLLDDPDWFALDADAARLLVELFLMGTEDEGKIPELAKLAFRLRRDSDLLARALKSLYINDFLCDASAVLADACLEGEGESEGESEGEREQTGVSFEELWGVHGRGPKKDALAQYRKALKSGVPHDTMASGLKKYVRSFSGDFTGQHLFRWIRDERWQENGAAPQTSLNLPRL